MDEREKREVTNLVGWLTNQVWRRAEGLPACTISEVNSVVQSTYEHIGIKP